VATVRVYKLLTTPEPEAIVATIRVALGEVPEERPSDREVLLHTPAGDARAAIRRLVGVLDRYHRYWRQFIVLSPGERSPR
jgi:hypothetical protein